MDLGVDLGVDLKVGDLVKNSYAIPEERVARIVKLTKTEVTFQDLPLGFPTDNYTYTLEYSHSVGIGKIRRCSKLEILLIGLDCEF